MFMKNSWITPEIDYLSLVQMENLNENPET